MKKLTMLIILLLSNNLLGNGVYTINNGTENYQVLCDMTTNGGGFNS